MKKFFETWKGKTTKFVKTTPQMTRFRDVKVCKNLGTDEIDDHRIQSDYKCTSGLQNPEGKKSVLGLRGKTERDTNDNVTTKTPEHIPHSAHEPQHVN